MSVPCPQCGRLYTWNGQRCCNRYCRLGSSLPPEIDHTERRRKAFLAAGGRPARAIWVPDWYGLDPPRLEIGRTAEYLFFPAWKEDERLRLQFYTGLPSGMPHAAWGTIASIQHAQFGPIRLIDAGGLDYHIVLIDGKEYCVNAEEQPGQLFEKHGEEWPESSMQIDDWTFTIEFSALADLEPMQKNA